MLGQAILYRIIIIRNIEYRSIIIRKVATQIMTDGSTIWCHKMHCREGGKSYKVKDNIPSFCRGELRSSAFMTVIPKPVEVS